MEKEYIVVTVKGVDVAEIDSQLQRDTSSDGAVPNTIPDRTVDVVNARAYNNRMTHYNLTDEEAQTLSTDARILSVCEKPLEETQELVPEQPVEFIHPDKPKLDALIESENISEAFFLARRLVASGEDWANSYLEICRSMM